MGRLRGGEVGGGGGGGGGLGLGGVGGGWGGWGLDLEPPLTGRSQNWPWDPTLRQRPF